MDPRLPRLLDLLDDAGGGTVGTSLRLPVRLREAAGAAIELGIGASATELTVQGLRAVLEAFAQRAVLDAHYKAHPEHHPDLAEIALATAELDGHPLAAQPELIQRAPATGSARAASGWWCPPRSGSRPRRRGSARHRRSPRYEHHRRPDLRPERLCDAGRVRIELLAADAFDQARAELARVLIECVEAGASVGFLAPLAVQEAEDFWRDALVAPQALTWAASSDGRIVGCVQLKLEPRPNGAHRGEVAKLLVAREARGRGVGTALMRALEAEASRRRRTLLLLDTATGSGAERLYRRLGWQAIGVVDDHAATPDGRLGPTTLMVKHVR